MPLLLLVLQVDQLYLLLLLLRAGVEAGAVVVRLVALRRAQENRAGLSLL